MSFRKLQTLKVLQYWPLIYNHKSICVYNYMTTGVLTLADRTGLGALI